jgi:Xaa-Pro aminopeptidase
MNLAGLGDRSALHARLAGLSEAEFRATYARRMNRYREEMGRLGIDVAVLTLGAEVPWLIGYEPMPLERITALVLPREGEAQLVVPELEAARVRDRGDLFRLRPWKESEDPLRLLEGVIGKAGSVAFSDRGWALWLLQLQNLPGIANTKFVSSNAIAEKTRRAKDEIEVINLAAAAAGADEVAELLFSGEIALEGRTERDVSEEIVRALIAHGHRHANFSIVASGPNAASPHHEPTGRVISSGDAVVCDFGGTYSVNGEPGYCSDTTRTLSVGEPAQEFADAFRVLEQSQELARAAAKVGAGLAEVDDAARAHLTAAGLGQYFFHRLGHGIGLEEHEEPYLAPHSVGVLEEGDAFSIEPGVYFAGKYGARIEDIAVCVDGETFVLNNSARSLRIV